MNTEDAITIHFRACDDGDTLALIDAAIGGYICRGIRLVRSPDGVDVLLPEGTPEEVLPHVDAEFTRTLYAAWQEETGTTGFDG